VHQLIFSASKLVDRAGIEPAPFRVSDGCTARRALGLWSPVQELNSIFRFTGAAHRRQCLRGPKTWSQRSESNAHRSPRLRALPCDCSTTELHRLEPKGGFEPPSERYEGSVFPTKLLRPSSSTSLERVTGFEPVSGPWQGPILAARRYPPGASGENRTLLACLEGRNSANKSRSLGLQ
jgi:hypothetical protein